MLAPEVANFLTKKPTEGSRKAFLSKFSDIFLAKAPSFHLQWLPVAKCNQLYEACLEESIGIKSRCDDQRFQVLEQLP